LNDPVFTSRFVGSANLLDAYFDTRNELLETCCYEHSRPFYLVTLKLELSVGIKQRLFRHNVVLT